MSTTTTAADVLDIIARHIDWTGVYEAYWTDLYATIQHIYGAAGNDTEYTDPHETPDAPDPCPQCGGIGWIEDEEGFAIDCDHGQPWDDDAPLF